MYDIRLKPKIRTVISLPSFSVQHRGTGVPDPQKEHADGGAIVWRTLEHPFVEKGRDWFLSVGIVAGALALASFILGNVLLGVFVVISAATLILFTLRAPAEIRCELNKNGFFVEKIRYAYKDIRSFWISGEKETPTLHVKTKSVYSPYLNIPLRKEDVPKVRGFLGRRVEEEEFAEPFSHRIAEALGL
ncbi:MAG: hypothetical protein HYT29_00975 [Parcubacteria group bacterium]|nr:hypothetical protein [Parcubacteria group bacterium]